MKQSFWNDFLISATKGMEKPPILYSILKQTKPIKNKHGVTITCSSHAIQSYLEKRKDKIEEKLTKYLNKPTVIDFTIVERKRKQAEKTPIFNYEPSIEDVFSKCGLSIKYNFDNFAVSTTNQVAHAAAKAVSNNLGTAYNPLFLYGNVGVGKTHLAQSIAKKILEINKKKRVFFCPGDLFINELIEAIRERTTPKFRQKYRKLSLLIVDDVQFIANKVTMQEEFFHTFNSIISSGGQIILTSDRPPHEIKNLEDRLRSRFSGGLTVDIQSPDFELRTAILLIKAKEKNIEIDISAAKIIAEQISDTREIEGVLLSIYAKILGKKEKIDLDSVEDFFINKNNDSAKKISYSDVIRTVCTYFNVKQSHIKGPKRTSELVLPRQLIMYILRNKLSLKQTEIARLLKRKDHTTVIYAVEKISRLLTKDQYLKQDTDKILQTLSLST